MSVSAWIGRGKAEMRIFSGNANPDLAERIAGYLKTDLGKVDIRRFPDGETFVRLQENIRGKDVFVVQSICGEPNDSLMELLIMIDAMRRASAARITAVLPLYGYARQDRKDQPRVPITAKLVANLLVAAGTNRLLTMDLHAQQIQGFFDIPVDHLYAAPVIVRYLQSKELTSPVVVAPDTGGVKMAFAYSQMLGTELAVVAKQRLGAEDVSAYTLVGDVDGRDAILVDDMTTTAGTLTAAARLLKERGAKRVVAAVSHGLLTPLAVSRLKESVLEELVVTDTVPQKANESFGVTVLSVADLLGEAIMRIHGDESVSSLFKL